MTETMTDGIRAIHVSRSELPALYAQFETDGYLIVSDDGHVAEPDKEMWATGYAVDQLDDADRKLQRTASQVAFATVGSSSSGKLHSLDCG